MERALLQRLLTAAVLIPLVVWAILALDSITLGLVLLPIIALAAWEWAGLAGFDRAAARLLYTVALVLLTAASGWAMQHGYAVQPLLWLALPLWLWALSVVLRYPASLPFNASGWFIALIGIPALLLPWLAVVLLHALPNEGPVWVLALMVVIWGADSAAYFSGRRFGRRKLAPAVSPGKSWEGLWGALVAIALATAGFALWQGLGIVSSAWLLALALFIVMVSVLGDLFESVLKRTRGVKDSGALLPGHGGVLDRIDSLTAAAPLFALGIMLLGFGTEQAA